jgi:pyridoxine/pyridoxamine 5'-phosphate oxidase
MNQEITLNDFAEEAWKDLRRATVDKKHPFRYFSLASTHQTQLRQRTVALRKIDEQSHLWVYTDYRAEKVSHFQAEPKASLLFFHPKQWLQIHIEAEVIIHYQDERSQEIWKGLPDSSRKDYTTAIAPGHELIINSEVPYLDEDNNYFCRLEFCPLSLEILQIRREGHQRARFKLVNDFWQGTWLVP